MITVNEYGEIRIDYKHLDGVKVKGKALIYLDAPNLIIQFTDLPEVLATQVHYMEGHIIMIDDCARHLFGLSSKFDIDRKTDNKLYLKRASI